MPGDVSSNLPAAAMDEEDWAVLRGTERFYCSDPPEESCSDAACPVHADGDDPGWDDTYDGTDWLRDDDA